MRAQTTTQKPASATPSGSAAASPAKGTWPLPFHGTISAVDQGRVDLHAGEQEMSRIFKITDKTVIINRATAATLQDITPNQNGTIITAAVQYEEVNRVRFNPPCSVSFVKTPSAAPSRRMRMNAAQDSATCEMIGEK